MNNSTSSSRNPRVQRSASIGPRLHYNYTGKTVPRSSQPKVSATPQEPERVRSTTESSLYNHNIPNYYEQSSSSIPSRPLPVIPVIVPAAEPNPVRSFSLYSAYDSQRELSPPKSPRGSRRAATIAQESDWKIIEEAKRNHHFQQQAEKLRIPDYYSPELLKPQSQAEVPVHHESRTHRKSSKLQTESPQFGSSHRITELKPVETNHQSAKPQSPTKVPVHHMSETHRQHSKLQSELPQSSYRPPERKPVETHYQSAKPQLLGHHQATSFPKQQSPAMPAHQQTSELQPVVPNFRASESKPLVTHHQAAATYLQSPESVATYHQTPKPQSLAYQPTTNGGFNRRLTIGYSPDQHREIQENERRFKEETRRRQAETEARLAEETRRKQEEAARRRSVDDDEEVEKFIKRLEQQMKDSRDSKNGVGALAGRQSQNPVETAASLTNALKTTSFEGRDDRTTTQSDADNSEEYTFLERIKNMKTDMNANRRKFAEHYYDFDDDDSELDSSNSINSFLSTVTEEDSEINDPQQLSPSVISYIHDLVDNILSSLDKVDFDEKELINEDLYNLYNYDKISDDAKQFFTPRTSAEE